MVLKKLVRSFIGMFHKLEDWSIRPEEKIYKGEGFEGESVDEIHSVWDYLQFKANTQAFHLAAVLGFDEWVDMGEIRRRIRELFGADYKNERSLYPYLKTLTDIGMMESSSVGGRMQRRKQDLLLKVGRKEGEKKPAAAVVAVRKKEKDRE